MAPPALWSSRTANNQHPAPSSVSMSNLQTSMDYIAAAAGASVVGGGVGSGGSDESVDTTSPLQLSVFPPATSQNSLQSVMSIATTPSTQGSTVSKLPPTLLPLQQQQQPQQQIISSQIAALPASSTSTMVFSTAGAQQAVPTTSSLTTPLKSLPQLVDNSRRTLQL